MSLFVQFTLVPSIVHMLMLFLWLMPNILYKIHVLLCFALSIEVISKMQISESSHMLLHHLVQNSEFLEPLVPMRRAFIFLVIAEIVVCFFNHKKTVRCSLYADISISGNIAYNCPRPGQFKCIVIVALRLGGFSAVCVEMHWANDSQPDCPDGSDTCESSLQGQGQAFKVRFTRSRLLRL